jgi:hypothetical protein
LTPFGDRDVLTGLEFRLQHLIHYFYYLLSCKVHSTPSQWSDLAAIAEAYGVTEYWPRPANDIEAQPFRLLKSEVKREDAFVSAAILKEKDINWEVYPLVPPESAGPAPIENPHNTTTGPHATIEVWRPDWEDEEAPR